MMRVGVLLTTVAMGLLAGCSGGRQTASTAPVWVTESPVNPAYYIGIGSASKAQHPLDADAVAKANALDNLSREIRVQVQSTSQTNTLQVNGWLSESFAQTSTSTTREDLEGYELVDTYSNGTDVVVYYRLSKAEHARIQAAKRQAAIERALGHLASATEAKLQGNAQQAVDAAIRGVDAVRPFMDKPLPATLPSGEEGDVGQALLATLDACIAGIELSTSLETATLFVEDAYSGNVEVQASLNGRPAPNVTLSYTYRRGDLPTRGQVVTDARGMATVRLERFEPHVTQTTLEVRVDPVAFAQGLPIAHPFQTAVRSLQSPPLRLEVALAPVELYVVLDELAFGKTRDREVLGPAIQQALQRANVTLVGSGNARQRTPANTMVLTVQADTRPGGSGQGFTTVYLDLVGTVTDASGATIFTQTKTNIKGIQLDLPRATDVAYDKGRVLMEEEFIPQLVRLWHGF